MSPRASERFFLGDFFEGLARCYEPTSKRFGYIDRTGAYAIEPAYHGGTPFSGGRAIVSDHKGGAQIIDREGRIVVPFSAGLRGALPFSEGRSILYR